LWWRSPLRSAPTASLQQKGPNWHYQFCHPGKRHPFSVGPVTEDEARAKSVQADDLLMQLKQWLIARLYGR
jgi:hypothetical protein